MNIHEYQGKSILSAHNVNVPFGLIASSPEEARDIAGTIKVKTGTDTWAVKAQIHAGGRGKGGGIKIAKSIDEVEKYASEIIGMDLITAQTGKRGRRVNKVLIEQGIYYPGESPVQEFYVSMILNRLVGRNTVIYTQEGGMEIEAVASKNPDLVFKEEIDSLIGLQAFQARKIAFNLGLTGKAFNEFIIFIMALYKAYLSSDATLLRSIL